MSSNVSASNDLFISADSVLVQFGNEIRLDSELQLGASVAAMNLVIRDEYTQTCTPASGKLNQHLLITRKSSSLNYSYCNKLDLHAKLC